MKNHSVRSTVISGQYPNSNLVPLLKVSRFVLTLALSWLLASCSSPPNLHSAQSKKASPTTAPNILWLVAEDLSPYIAPYGDDTAPTPNLNQLAAQGVVYQNVFSTSGVCAPSRAALATGMYPSSIGANHMRTGSYTHVTGLPKYEAVPPPSVKTLSQHLRAQGYYTTNNDKTDYQFEAPKVAWDESSPSAHWRNRPKGSPFFSVFNLGITHESSLFEPYGFKQIKLRHYHSGDKQSIEALPKGKTKESDTAVHLAKDSDFNIPPYLPDTETVRRDMWKMYNNIAEMDRHIGVIINQLKEDGLLDNTIIFFYGDHGGPLPRQKRLIYDSGLRVPLIIRFPHARNAGKVDEQLISFIDFPPTVMTLAGITPPDHLHGRNFINSDKREREYVHAAADRFDGFTDAIRAVRGKRYKYIRNYRPEQGYYLPVEYRERIPTMQELLALRKQGKLNAIQAQWFRSQKPKEELFDTWEDPHELNNIASEKKYASVLGELRTEMDRWLEDINDIPNTPEKQLVATLWDGSDTKPKTLKPEVQVKDGIIKINSQTEGANIGYKLVKNGVEPEVWSLYKGPIVATKGAQLLAVAHRIGFAESPVISVDIKP